MFGFGFWEIVVIVLALIVFVKPKELPKLLYRVGKMYGQLQELNRNLKQSMRGFERHFEVGGAAGEARNPAPENAASTAGPDGSSTAGPEPKEADNADREAGRDPRNEEPGGGERSSGDRGSR